jgi:DNA invertase Pin-like site-specific DNA recombinase
MTKYVAYARVSTARQGRSGLGLEAQEAAIQGFLKDGDELLAPLYVEVESGKDADRPKLALALDRAKLTGATLLVAKLDRLSRNVAFISALMDAGVDFVAVDQPHANRFTIHILAAVAEHERKMISERTRVALQAAKERGVKLGGFRGVKVDQSKGAAANVAKGRAFARRVSAAIGELQQDGVTSYAGIARGLDALGIQTSRGGSWQATQVARVMASLGEAA